MTDRSAAAGHSLAGVRLGALERTLLMSAPPLYAWGGGLLIDAPEGTRSAQPAGLSTRREEARAPRARAPRSCGRGDASV